MSVEIIEQLRRKTGTPISFDEKMAIEKWCVRFKNICDLNNLSYGKTFQKLSGKNRNVFNSICQLRTRPPEGLMKELENLIIECGWKLPD